jgi:hypothetical protein
MEVPDWAALTDEQLLERRISKLGLRFEATLRRFSSLKIARIRRSASLRLGDELGKSRVFAQRIPEWVELEVCNR